MQVKTIDKNVFLESVKNLKIRKNSQVNLIRQAILENDKDKEIKESLHYQSYKNLQREMLASKTCFLVHADKSEDNKHVLSIHVCYDAEIIDQFYAEFLKNDKKFKALIDNE